MNATWLYDDKTSSAARASRAVRASSGLELKLVAVSRALNYFNFTFSRKVYIQSTGIYIITSSTHRSASARRPDFDGTS